MTRRLTLAALVLAGAVAAACSGPPPDPIQLERNQLTITNASKEDWSNVEIWLNTYFRATAPAIPAGGRFQLSLDSFVTGFGQRFNFQRMQVKDLRLTAKGAGGRPIEIKKEWSASGLAGALGGKR
jgi:hypothetical protein